MPQYTIQYTNIDGGGYLPDPLRKLGTIEFPQVFDTLVEAVALTREKASKANARTSEDSRGITYNPDAFYYKVRDKEHGRLVYKAPFQCGRPERMDRVEEEWFGSYRGVYEEELKGVL